MHRFLLVKDIVLTGTMRMLNRAAGNKGQSDKDLDSTFMLFRPCSSLFHANQITTQVQIPIVAQTRVDHYIQDIKLSIDKRQTQSENTTGQLGSSLCHSNAGNALARPNYLRTWLP